MASVVTVQAQYAYPSEITSRGSKIIADGEVLTTEQATELFSEFGGMQMGEDYVKTERASGQASVCPLPDLRFLH